VGIISIYYNGKKLFKYPGICEMKKFVILFDNTYVIYDISGLNTDSSGYLEYMLLFEQSELLCIVAVTEYTRSHICMN